MSEQPLTRRALAILDLLESFEGETMREGLKETPERAAKAWGEWTAGYSINPAALLKSFEDGAKNYNQMVVCRDIPVYSMCEHHLAPFFGRAHIAYLPVSRIVGLSKFPRVVKAFSQRLQVQERLTQEIAECIRETLQPKGVGVVLECRHLCMESRGVQARDVVTTTSTLLGVFDQAQVRAEFFTLAQVGRPV